MASLLRWGVRESSVPNVNRDTRFHLQLNIDIGDFMKLAVFVTGIFLMAAGMVQAASFGEGYANRLRESRNARNSGEWIYLNQPSEYQGPGRLVECRKVSTYQGGPKNGMWRTYYVCRAE